MAKHFFSPYFLRILLIVLAVLVLISAGANIYLYSKLGNKNMVIFLAQESCAGECADAKAFIHSLCSKSGLDFTEMKYAGSLPFGYVIMYNNHILISSYKNKDLTQSQFCGFTGIKSICPEK